MPWRSVTPVRASRKLMLAGLTAMLAEVSPAAPPPAGCPAPAQPVSEQWSPIKWRDPLAMCTCPRDTYCRGPYCQASPTGSAFVAGCAACQCLPLCDDPLACWEDRCICRHQAEQSVQPRDPHAPHSPAQIEAALGESFPGGAPHPSSHLPQYKNPCWHDDAKAALRCLPFAYIPGILKCATSALYDVLEKHPDVQVSYPKETHWWTDAFQ